MWKRIGLILALLLLYANADAAVRTTLQNAATATGDGNLMTVDDKGAAGLTVKGTFVGTVAFYGSTDGGITWTARQCVSVDTFAGVTTTTSTGQYLCHVAGISHFKAQITAYTSGSITVIGTASNGSDIGMLFDGSGNGFSTLGTLISGEDQTNNLLMTSGGVVRTTTFGSVTSATTSTISAVPIGSKTFVAQIINATSETKAATLTIYGNVISSTTGGIPLCTITLPSTVTVLQLQDACPVVTANFAYYYYTATVYTSASSAPLTVYAHY